MAKQLNIRSDFAYELATDMASRHGKTVARVVEEALTAYRAQEIESRRARWLELLHEDWKHLNDSGFKIEDLYDPETGLPA